MKREDLKELHYITAIDNVPSILKRGLLSNHRVKKLGHVSVADQGVQEKREDKQIPGGRPLHDYVNLYICARNPMMYRRKSMHAKLAVLRVSVDVLDIEGAVVSDSNAASKYVRFAAAPGGISHVDKSMVFAEDWTSSDQIQGWRQAAAKCAEVLVPHKVAPEHILGAYVSGAAGEAALRAVAPDLTIELNAHMFFAE